VRYSSYGDLSLQEYARVLGVKRRSRLKVALLSVCALAVCLLCMAAGDLTGIWTGKNSRSLAFADGMRLLVDPNPQAVAAGMIAVQREMLAGLDAIARTDGVAGPQGDYAAVSLMTVTSRAVDHLKKLATVERNRARTDKFFAQLRDSMK
jgi:hypothetical protein